MERCRLPTGLPTMDSSSSSSDDDSELRYGGTATTSDVEKTVKKSKTRKTLLRRFPERPRKVSTSGEGLKGKRLRDAESFCRICARGGPFMKCHTCTAVYHKTCMYEAAWIRAANGTWRCPNCLYMGMKDALRPDNLTVKENFRRERTQERQ